MYWDINKLLSYNALFNYVIGERGVGKSYGTKDYLIRHFKKTNKKFVWLRRTWRDLETAIGNNKNKHFFDQIKDKHNLEDFSITSNEKLYYLSYKSKIMGYATSFRNAESIKGTSFDNIDFIIIDEFLVGDAGSRYLKNEVDYILSIYETISRMNDVRVIFLGNATSVFNPYFIAFDIHLPYNSEYQTFKNGLILVNYIKNEKYRQAKKETRYGQLIAGTKYEAYAIDNQFINDSADFIRKKHNKSKHIFNININKKIYGIWIHKNNLYISSKFNLSCKTTVTYDLKSHNEKTRLYKSRNVFFINLGLHFKNGTLFFENQEIKHRVIDLLVELRLLY